MADEPRRKGLGRGLSALMAEVRNVAPPPPVGYSGGNNQGTAAEISAGAGGRGVRELPIEQVVPNPHQPRKRFTPEALDELVSSIKARGVLQPLLVRKVGPGDRYEIIAGERRWRAAQTAQLHTVPVILKDFTDSEVVEVSLIENIQRADLTPVEEAEGYQRLIGEFSHTQEVLATLLGKSRSYIANTLRLLTLPSEVRGLLDEGRLSVGHARALIGLPNAVDVALKVAAEGMTVRQVEELAKASKAPAKVAKAGRGHAVPKDIDTLVIEGDLAAAVGLPVSIGHKGGADGSGTVTLHYRTLDELDALCRRLSRPEN